MASFLKQENLSQFLITPDMIDQVDSATDTNDIKLTPREVEVLKNLMVETQDLLEMNDFSRVLLSSVDVGFTSLDDSMFLCFVPSMTDSIDLQDSFPNPNIVEIKLAKLLPKMHKILSGRNGGTENVGLIRHLICLDVLNCYSANVFEAFCHPQPQLKPQDQQPSMSSSG
jgi:hypothetical protein